MAKLNQKKFLYLIGGFIAIVLVAAAMQWINGIRNFPFEYFQSKCEKVLNLTHEELRGLGDDISIIRPRLAQKVHGGALAADEIQLGEFARKVHPIFVSGDSQGQVCFTLSSGVSPYSYLYFEKDGRINLDPKGEMVVIWPLGQREDSKIMTLLEHLGEGK